MHIQAPPPDRRKIPSCRIGALTRSRIGARAMPPQPTWFHRLPEILEVLRGFDTDDILREAFWVGQR